MLSRRLLAGGSGSGALLPAPAFDVSGPYDSGYDGSSRVLAQFHCHTTGSDGDYTPAQVVADYLGAGYGALMISDHNVVTTQPAGITTAITGQEHSKNEQHIIAINTDYTSAVTDAQTIVDAIVADGGQAEVAHPNWSVGMSPAELAALTDYLGFEIHNTHVVSGAGQNPVTFPGYAVELWDELLSGGRRDLWGFAVDDLHTIGAYTTYDVGRVQLFLPSNNSTNVMAALVSGNFAADVSNYGVTPGFPVRTGSSISVECPGAIRVEAWGASGLLAATAADHITQPFDDGEPYIRLVAIGDYSEGFGSALSDRWYVVDGSWSVSGGVLSVSTDGTNRRLILRRHRQGDFTMQVDAKIGSGGGDAIGIMFNVLDADHWFMLRIGESPVSGYNNVLAVAKTTNGGFANDSQLDNAAFDPDPDVWYTLKLAYTASSGRMRGKVWERATTEPDWMVDVTDTTWTHGGFGLRANRTGSYDNLYISGFQTFYQPVAVDPA